MAIIARQFSILANGANLACFFDTLGISHETEEIDTTKLCDSNRRVLPGIKKSSATWSGCYDTDQVNQDKLDDIFSDAFESQGDIILSISPGIPAVGSLAFLATTKTISYNVDAPVGELINANGNLSTKEGSIYHGKMLFYLDADSGEVIGAEVDDLADSINGFVFNMHLYLEDDSTASDGSFILQHATGAGAFVDITPSIAIGANKGAKVYVGISGTQLLQRVRVKFTAVGGKAYGAVSYKRI